MIEVLALRASAMPLAFRCAASVRTPEIQIRESSEPADLGSATHEALEPLAEGFGVQWDDLSEIAERWAISPDELRMLCAVATKLWPKIEASFPNALTEVEYSVALTDGVTLSGHADILSILGRVARGGDWKTGRKDHDYSQQMRAYCALVLLTESSIDEVTFTVVWLREGEIETYSMHRDQLGAWLDELQRKVIHWDGVYRPGPHCGWCHRSHECPARTGMIRRDVAAFAESPTLDVLMPAEILTMFRRAKMVQDAAERVQVLVREYVERYGDIVTDDGRLTLVDEPKRSVDAGKAWAVLQDAGFDDDDMLAAIKISIGAIEKRAATRAGRGKGAAAVRALAERLEAAEAIIHTTTRKLQEKR